MLRFTSAFGCEAHLLVTYETLLLTVISNQQFRTKAGNRIPAMNVNMAAWLLSTPSLPRWKVGSWG